MELPAIPYSPDQILANLKSANSHGEVQKVVEPFLERENKLRQIYAQEPWNPSTFENHAVPLFSSKSCDLTVKARQLDLESTNERSKYLLPLTKGARRLHGSPAIVPTLKEFRENFEIFSESALSRMNWENVVVAGSCTVTALLPVHPSLKSSRRVHRKYYHDVLAPASDVDLFLYGLTEDQALAKIAQIESDIRNAIWSESTVVRTKNTITIVSQYPVRHIQIVLRLYKTFSEMLTGFDVDCSCVAYDGKQVWASPRAVAAFATQVNTIDLKRRSPSYENRLFKYAHRGFEVYWPILDRARIDPTIFERSFRRVQGLARLLILEKLPNPDDRDRYADKRRKERGRPQLPHNYRFKSRLVGNSKDRQPEDVAEWFQGDEISSYHTACVPWGPRYSARKIERLLFTQDLLKNAEWNRPKDRKTNLHRHPAFFGVLEDVLGDCCGSCPAPTTEEDFDALETESKIFVSGRVSFLTDDPGRQEIGSFYPLTADDWTEMAYIGDTARLCQAIVNQDIEKIKDWLSEDNADINARDHTGRTPLHLAVMTSTPEIVEILVDHGARLTACLYNGNNALHLAAFRGSDAIVKILLDRSIQNEVQESAKRERRAILRMQGAANNRLSDQDVDTDGDINMPDQRDPDIDLLDDQTTSSFVKIDSTTVFDSNGFAVNDDLPDVFDVNAVAWDSRCSALHLAIIGGHTNVIKLLSQQYGADTMQPVNIMTTSIPQRVSGSILPLLLPSHLSPQIALSTTQCLLEHGSSHMQADKDEATALHHLINQSHDRILSAYESVDKSALALDINHLIMCGTKSSSEGRVRYPLLSAIETGHLDTVQKVLELGAKVVVDFDQYVQCARLKDCFKNFNSDEMLNLYRDRVIQPVIRAASLDKTVNLVPLLLEKGADVNTLMPRAWRYIQGPERWRYSSHGSLLDVVRDRREQYEKYTPPIPKSDVVDEDIHFVTGKDEDYLSGYMPGSYQSWSAERDLELARYVQQQTNLHLSYRREKAKEEKAPEGSEAKAAKIAEMIKTLKSVEACLVSKNAKTLKDLCPVNEPVPQISHPVTHKQSRPSERSQETGEKYKIKLHFHGSLVSSSQDGRILEMFEAAYNGNNNVIRKLCLHSNGIDPPLNVSVYDANGFDPFSIAVLRKHYDTAQLLLEIAAAQYEGTSDQKHETGHDLDSDFPQIHFRLIDEDFTIQDVSALSRKVKSTVRATNLLHRRCQVWRMMDMPREEALRQLGVDRLFDPSARLDERVQSRFAANYAAEKERSSCQLWDYAIAMNDTTLMKFLLTSEVRFAEKPADELLPPSWARRDGDFFKTIQVGHIEMLEILISHSGCLFPHQDLAAASGFVIDEDPESYKGLTIHGKKRERWAPSYIPHKQLNNSPVLTAICHGDLRVIKYFLSDAAMDKYREFCSRFKDEKSLKFLQSRSGGLDQLLESWFHARKYLAIHIALLSWPANLNVLLRYLLKTMPSGYLEAKNRLGLTPLHVACSLGNVPAIEILVAAGCNQRTRDLQGKNLLHAIYQSANSDRVELFKRTVGLLDAEIVSCLLRERSKGPDMESVTPLAMHLEQCSSWDVASRKLLTAMLEISNGADLVVMNGAGDYPIHNEVKNLSERAVFLARFDPSILYRENATGMTPLDFAQITFIQSITDHVPRLPHHSRSDEQKIYLHEHDSNFCAPPVTLFEEVEGVEMHTTSSDHNLARKTLILRRLEYIARANPQSRILVSALDANEVAKRLASQELRRESNWHHREIQSHEEDPQQICDALEADSVGYDGWERSERDEVDSWWSYASNRRAQLPFFAHHDDTKEATNLLLQKWRDFAEGKVDVVACCEQAENEDVLVRRDH